jgi:hypothetical protein
MYPSVSCIRKICLFQCSGSSLVLISVVDPCHLGTDPDPGLRIYDPDQRIRVLLFSSLTFKTPSKTFCLLSAYYFLKVYLHHFSKIKSHKEKSQNSMNQGVFVLFLLDDRRIQIRTSD